MRTYEKCVRKPFGMRIYKIIGLKASQNQHLQKKAGVPLSLCPAAIRREDGLLDMVEAPEFQWDAFKALDADASRRRPMTRKTLDRSFNRNTGQGLLISALDVQGRFRYSFRRNGASGTSPASSPPQRSTVPAEAWVANFRLHSLARWRGKRQRAFCFGGSVARCLHGFRSAGTLSNRARRYGAIEDSGPKARAGVSERTGLSGEKVDFCRVGGDRRAWNSISANRVA